MSTLSQIVGRARLMDTGPHAIVELDTIGRDHYAALSTPLRLLVEPTERHGWLWILSVIDAQSRIVVDAAVTDSNQLDAAVEWFLDFASARYGVEILHE